MTSNAGINERVARHDSEGWSACLFVFDAPIRPTADSAATAIAHRLGVNPLTDVADGGLETDDLHHVYVLLKL